MTMLTADTLPPELEPAVVFEKRAQALDGDAQAIRELHVLPITDAWAKRCADADGVDPHDDQTRGEYYRAAAAWVSVEVEERLVRRWSGHDHRED